MCFSNTADGGVCCSISSTSRFLTTAEPVFMFQIAITGGIACGKTTIGRSLESWGYPVWEADEAARVLLAPGQSGYEWAVQTFGGRVTRADGSINREVLARLVFADGTALQA